MERNYTSADTGISKGVGGVYSTKCHTERLCSEVRPLTVTTFYIPFLTEQLPLSYSYRSLQFYIFSYCFK